MAVYNSTNIKNVVVLGHLGSGKTSVLEAIAYRANMIDKLGSIAQGNTISDFDAEEIRRKSSIHTSIVPVEWKNHKINFLDTPGTSELVGEINQAIYVADSALIVVPATAGLTVGTIQSMQRASHLPKMIYINGLDDPASDYQAKLDILKKTYGNAIAPIQVPIMEGNKMVGYVNVAKMEGRMFNGDRTEKAPIPESMMPEIEPVREMILEAVANTNDYLLEKYIEGEEFTKDEISLALRVGVFNQTLIPVLCGTSQIGIQIILNSIVSFFPSAIDIVNSHIATNEDTGDEDILGYDEDLPTSLFVFKTIADPFVGKMSIFKVNTGSIIPGKTLYNTRSKELEKISKLYTVRGKELVEADRLYAGDIGAFTKLQYTNTNDTLCATNYKVQYEPIDYPKPYYTKAIVASKNNEDKIISAINRLLDEDPTLNFEMNAETKQQLLSGMGKTHLDITLAKLKNKFKIDVTLTDVIVPYRETIRGVYKQRYKYKKQSGGHGQYGDVEIIFEPSNDLSEPYTFEEKIFGGAVPKAYFPAVEKGLQEAVKEGVLAGYPMIGVKATLVDGSYHTVDSSEMAFKTATIMCFKEGIPKAKPAILEPFYTLKVYVADSYTGDVMSDFNKKRARVLSMDHVDDQTVCVEAQAPYSEITEYAVDLKAMTQGLGTFEMEFLDYEFVPENIQKRIIDSKK